MSCEEFQEMAGEVARSESRAAAKEIAEYQSFYNKFGFPLEYLSTLSNLDAAEYTEIFLQRGEMAAQDWVRGRVSKE